MSKKKKSRSVAKAAPKDDLPLNNFLRGFIATGLLTALQNRRSTRPAPLHVLGRAVQGGAALAAGVSTANALQRGEYARALGSAVAGAAGVALVEYAVNRCEELAEERIEE
jgi:hypothetical protein